MPCLTRVFILYGIVLGVVPSIHAQTPPPQVFEWYFAGTQTVSASLPSCRTFPLAADARTANGTPPFYMMAFDVGGSPLTSFIGTNQSNLTWTVAHPVGSQLVLGMVDALGQSGGISPTLYNVTAGATTQCVPPTVSEPTPFKISANVTDVLNTCQPWGLTIEGGTPPYNITLAELNLGNVTNVTLGPTDTVFTYINRMVPGGQVIASASDINGRWATGSPFVRTQGSTDISCVGLVSSGSIGTSPSGSHTSHHKLSHAQKIGIIVGVLVAGVLLCAIIGFVVRRRRRRMMESSPNSLPEAVAVTPFMRQNGRALTGAHSNMNSGSTAAPTRTQSKRSTVTHSTTTAETSSSSPSSPSPSSPRVLVVRELPPPYPNWLR